MTSSTVERIVIFFDCHSFSLVQMELGSRTLDFMDEMYRRAGDCIVSRGGRVVKYIGDAMLALFPAESADEAVQAARCVRERYAAQIREHRTDFSGEIVDV